MFASILLLTHLFFVYDRSASLELAEVRVYLTVVLILVVRLRGLEEGAEKIGSAEEAEHKQRAVAVAAAKSEALFALIDTDHSDGIDRSEFCAFLRQLESGAASGAAQRGGEGGAAHIVASADEIAQLRDALFEETSLRDVLERLFAAATKAGECLLLYTVTFTRILLTV